MKRFELLLTQLAEECNEVAVRCGKAVRFGLSEKQPGQDLTNADRLKAEMVDLFALWVMLVDEGHVTQIFLDEPEFKAKRQKVEKFLELSRRQGILED